jgi:4-oxalocrotonate tautomerase
MPLISFESGKLDAETKKQLIQKLTEVSSEITKVPKEYFFVSIKELPDENIGIGSESILEIKKRFLK